MANDMGKSPRNNPSEVKDLLAKLTNEYVLRQMKKEAEEKAKIEEERQREIRREFYETHPEFSRTFDSLHAVKDEPCEEEPNLENTAVEQDEEDIFADIPIERPNNEAFDGNIGENEAQIEENIEEITENSEKTKLIDAVFDEDEPKNEVEIVTAPTIQIPSAPKEEIKETEQLEKTQVIEAPTEKIPATTSQIKKPKTKRYNGGYIQENLFDEEYMKHYTAEFESAADDDEEKEETIGYKVGQIFRISEEFDAYPQEQPEEKHIELPPLEESYTDISKLDELFNIPADNEVYQKTEKRIYRFVSRKKDEEKTEREVLHKFFKEEEPVKNNTATEIPTPDDIDDDIITQQEYVISPQTEELPMPKKSIWSIFKKNRYSDEEDATAPLGETDELELVEEEIDKSAPMPDEFVSFDQAKEIFARYKLCYKYVKFKAIISAIILFLMLAIEALPNFGVTLPYIFSPEYPIQYTLIDFQLVILTAILVWDKLYYGMKRIFARDIDGSVFLIFGLLLSIITTAVNLLSNPDNTLRLFNAPFAFFAFIILVGDMLIIRSEVYSFKIISSQDDKFVLENMSSDERVKHIRMFDEYLPQNPSFFRTCRTKFVNDFFARTNDYSSLNKMFGALIGILFGIAIALSLVGVFTDKGIIQSVSMGYAATLFCIPACIVFGQCLCVFIASKEAYEKDSAIIGEYSSESFDPASVISVCDDEVFTSKNIKLKTVKVYGDNQIDKVLYYTACAFSPLGGPVAGVLTNTIQDMTEKADAKIVSIAENGFESIVNGTRVVIGRSEYMEEQCYIVHYDKGDDELVFNSTVRILYVAIGNEIAAKLYLKYYFDDNFGFMLRQIARAKICVSIKTFDPNIDDELLKTKFDTEKCPVKILKCTELSQKKTTVDFSSGNVVSKRGVGGLLYALVLCDRLVQARKFNKMLTFAAVILGTLGSLALILLNKFTYISSLYIVLYEFLWLVPTFIVSKMRLRK